MGPGVRAAGLEVGAQRAPRLLVGINFLLHETISFESGVQISFENNQTSRYLLLFPNPFSITKHLAMFLLRVKYLLTGIQTTCPYPEA